MFEIGLSLLLLPLQLVCSCAHLRNLGGLLIDCCSVHFVCVCVCVCVRTHTYMLAFAHKLKILKSNLILLEACQVDKK